MSISDNIKKYRKEKKLTQKQLADMIDKKEITIRRYEKGDIIPPIPAVEDIAKALDIDILRLIVDDNEMVEEEDLIKIKNGIADERIIYSKPSVIKEIDKKSEFYEYLANILRSEFLQDEFNYKYEEFVTQEDFDEIVEFIFEMFKMKIDQIKLKKINKDSTTAPRPVKILEDIDRKFSEILELEFFKLNK